MAVTKIRGNTQIIANSITDTEINSAAAIATSKLAGGIEFIQRDGSIAFTADQSMGSNKLIGLASPIATTDAANKSYVDGVASGLDVKASVRLVTPGALPTNFSQGGPGIGKELVATVAAALTIDGIEPIVGDRVLVKNEATGSDNGIYELTQIGSGAQSWKLQRTTDADEDTEVTAGMFTFVEEGGAGADTGWVLSTNDPITVDTTALVFTQFSTAGVIVAGAGLTKSGNTIDFVATDASILVVTDSAKVQFDATAGTISLGGVGIQIADGTAGEILIGKGGGSDTAFTAISGDATLGSTGVLSLVTSAFLVTREVPSGSINGSNTVFTLANTPTVGTEMIYLNGMLQNVGGSNDYTISSATITFNTAPLTASVLLVTYWK